MTQAAPIPLKATMAALDLAEGEMPDWGHLLPTARGRIATDDGRGPHEVAVAEAIIAASFAGQAQPLPAINPFTLAANQTAVAVNLVHGTGAGRITRLNVPTAQMQRPQGLENAQGITEWPLSLMPLASGAGNNQWTLTLT